MSVSIGGHIKGESMTGVLFYVSMILHVQICKKLKGKRHFVRRLCMFQMNNIHFRSLSPEHIHPDEIFSGRFNVKLHLNFKKIVGRRKTVPL